MPKDHDHDHERDPHHGNGAPPPPPPPPPEEHKKPKRKKRRLFRKLLFLLILVLLIFIALYLWKGPGLGPGSGGTETNPPAVNSTEPSTPAEPAGTTEGDAKVVIVRIDGETVSVNGTVVEDADALKEAVLGLSTDDTVFQLEDNDSILATHDWVTQAFEELSLPLVEGK